ncbi:MAG: hypothetical protein AAF743_15485 [Planctomycetota bacterium]
MAIADSTAQLNQAAKDLHLHWRQTREVWRDGLADQLDQEIIEPLLASVRTATDAMNRLQESVAQARRACTDDR